MDDFEPDADDNKHSVNIFFSHTSNWLPENFSDWPHINGVVQKCGIPTTVEL